MIALLPLGYAKKAEDNFLRRRTGAAPYNSTKGESSMSKGMDRKKETKKPKKKKP
jgi:hypothetical protein